jgi:hypothetical protein
MEDERIARTILSALLQKDIVKVEVRPHEYSSNKRDTLSVFRIDFGATIRESNGSEHLILIELQKTWLPTETLRFRQYLGVQYENPANIIADSDDQHALPMVAVYLLGHKVGDIEEPVLYVHHRTYDYEGKVVTKGLPDPFVDSLTHDSIIVQIPRLHGKINNRLDEILSIFDQTRKDSRNQQMLNIDDTQYPDDDVEMQHILRRLLMAATNAEMRMDMNVEDEYFSIIEKRDTEIMQRDRRIAEQNVEIAAKDEQLNQKDEQLSQKDEQLSQKDEQLSQKDEQLNQKDKQLSQKDKQLNQKNEQLNQKNEQLNQKNEQLNQKNEQLLASIRLLLQAGMTVDEIVGKLNISKDFVISVQH